MPWEHRRLAVGGWWDGDAEATQPCARPQAALPGTDETCVSPGVQVHGQGCAPSLACPHTAWG